MTRKEIAEADGAGTALALTGHAPFGDCQSIRHRLHAARARLAELKDLIKCGLPKTDWVMQIWQRDIKIWEYAIQEGEKLLKRKLKKLEIR